MTTIWKYEVFPIDNMQSFDMPAGAEIVDFGLDPQGALCFWALVNTEARLVERHVWCVGTGWPLEECGIAQEVVYVGRANNGPYVWHLIEEVTEYELE